MAARDARQPIGCGARTADKSDDRDRSCRRIAADYRCSGLGGSGGGGQESIAVIPVASNVQIWIVTGHRQPILTRDSASIPPGSNRPAKVMLSSKYYLETSLVIVSFDGSLERDISLSSSKQFKLPFVAEENILIDTVSDTRHIPFRSMLPDCPRISTAKSKV